MQNTGPRNRGVDTPHSHRRFSLTRPIVAASRFTCDARRIYIPRGNYVMVLDEGTGKVIADMPDMKRLHGVAVVPEFNKGCSTGNQSEDELHFADRIWSI